MYAKPLIRHSVCKSCWVAALFVVLCGVTLWAQAPVGSISGVVKDATGGVIVGATITLESLSTGAKRVTSTNESGLYNISTLLPGEYRMTVEYPGFAVYGVDRVVVEVGQIRRIDPVLTHQLHKKLAM